MKAEYKRDINGNYLVLYENEEPDTSSYQIRMLVGNTIKTVKLAKQIAEDEEKKAIEEALQEIRKEKRNNR